VRSRGADRRGKREVKGRLGKKGVCTQAQKQKNKLRLYDSGEHGGNLGGGPSKRCRVPPRMKNTKKKKDAEPDRIIALEQANAGRSENTSGGKVQGTTLPPKNSLSLAKKYESADRETKKC